ncbi:MAG: HAD family phosphatase [Clostridia bacterium]|nr:HAD family phosphatase [Clostridia bacterium]
MEPKGALFDMDGTLVDSMWVWDKILSDFLVENGLPLDDGFADDVAHMSPQISSVYARERYQLPQSSQEIYQRWMEQASLAYKEQVLMKPGAKEYLFHLKKSGVRMAVVTACDPQLVRTCLTQNGVFELFDTIVYVDDVGKGKDFPDLYIEAMKRLGVKPQNATLHEDILVGIRTASKLGLRTVAVEDEWQENKTLLQKEADLYIRDFFELLEGEKQC